MANGESGGEPKLKRTRVIELAGQTTSHKDGDEDTKVNTRVKDGKALILRLKSSLEEEDLRHNKVAAAAAANENNNSSSGSSQKGMPTSKQRQQQQ